MSNHFRSTADLPLQQKAIRDKCFHRTGTFIKFDEEEREQAISDRFEHQVLKYPDRLALKIKTHELTYAELNKTSNQIAHAILAQQGTGEERIALLLQPGAPVVAAILGVLKAGKCYVPLDPSHPLARTGHIVRESQATLILTDNQNLPLASELVRGPARLMNADEIDSSISDENPKLSVPAGALACILFTSGSTGPPKGVVHTHRTMLHMTMNHTNMYHICPEDRVNLVYSAGVIGGVRDIFGALLNGAAVFPFDLKEEGVHKLANWLIEGGLTTYRSAATVFRQFVSTLTGQESFPSLRLVYLGNETLYPSDVELYKKCFGPDCILSVGFGTTEMNVVRQYFIDMSSQTTGATLPAGYPVDGVTILVLDSTGNEVGFNRTGEIAIKSRYLSPGYWRNPELTEARFLPDPAGGDERIYLTGDLGEMSPDGCLMHQGRKDSQVKVRGFSVSVAEIEAALLTLGTIKEAVVMAREDRPGNLRLVAYVVPARQPAPSITALRSFLQAKLPDYMVPSAFVFLDVLPTLPTGKVDRRGLPAPGSARPELGTSFVGPRTPVEQGLTEIWAEVLGLDQVGIQDNFLDLGGDSLLASQVISRMIRTFRVELPIRSLLEASTVADMAVAITQDRAKSAGQSDIDRMLAELEALSDTEAKQLMADGNT